MKTYLVDFENVKSKGLVGIDRLDSDDNVIIFYSENSDTISFEMHCQVLKAKASVEYMKVRVGGKNALDFQLSTLLGYIVAKGNNSHVFVISGDKGFDKLHDFWENTFPDSPGCSVFRTNNILSAINYAHSNSKPEYIEDISDDSDIGDINADISATISDIDISLDNISSDIHSSISSVISDDIFTETISGKVVEILPAANVPADPISKLIPDVTDDEKQLLISLFISSDSKLELHNELMKKIENERSTYLYNHLKSNFYTLKNEFTQNAPSSAAAVKAETKTDMDKSDSANTGADVKAEEKVARPGRKKKTDREEPAPKQTAAVEEKTAQSSAGDNGAKKVTPSEKKKLHALLDDISDGDEFSGVVAQFNCSATAQQLYINLMQRFGQERGRELYKLVKPEFLSYNTAVKKPKKTASGKKQPETETAVAADVGKRLRELAGELTAADDIEKLRGCISGSESVHSLYLSLIKGFGKKRGTAIYNKIKKEHESLRGALAAEVVK